MKSVKKILKTHVVAEITDEKAKELLESGSEPMYRPLGLFFLKDGNRWSVIDNARGYANTESFVNKKIAFNWLVRIIDTATAYKKDAKYEKRLK